MSVQAIGRPTVLEARDLDFTYHAGFSLLPGGRVGHHAVRGVSLTLGQGETLGLVGESGCGKSTLAALLCGDYPPDHGTMELFGEPFASYLRPNRRRLARVLQVVAQDTLGAFDPRHTIGRQIEEVLFIHAIGCKSERRDRAKDALGAVALPGAMLDRYPHQMSGGQRQRAAIARALVTEPKILLCDEPVSALDVSVQAQVLNLLLELQEKRGLSILFISHDVRVVRHVSHRVVVMQAGRVVESGPTSTVFAAPSDPYTAKLLAAVPKGKRRATSADRASNRSILTEARAC
ncbi:ABC transporter ATP-binding protein [Dickeya solani]|uniref:ABC-type oligopeptide transport system, ATPase component n=1 Tax=Dickeya solani D s0432-1 TaxID=1231725 RepID=A0AAV3KD73_9GAMM|nr:ATP-binding cassette domain-containing protein [Dickeya solani]ANE77014.1 peptide ABC transporter ATP-binding protein [Dickeya solani IPO 2222]AUC44765.1 Oligopeptide transport ATP-binding protein OppF [Dickeya solani RNS 08.23.3.1.A]AUH07576.1 peptide ABC transporter ATP-binding protein [Dickeya solani D s0432-1]AUH11605.1 peptide ABC transporter ATP-binding protein [Dickeya solani]AYQ47572.1 putative D,D-dipeptide transport ATP-binding protein DdpF [Dickeya solani]